MHSRAFGSDNWSGVHPDVLAAIAAANVGHAPSYGNEDWTKEAVKKIRALVGKDCDVYLLFSGTAANVLGLQSMVRSHQAVICAETAHVHTSEAGAAEKHIGCKLIPLPAPKGKISSADIPKQLGYLGNEHHVQPKAVTVTQSTEYGTVYSLGELKEISKVTHDNGMYLHMDGARIFNAAVSLGCSIEETTRGAGVDVLSFGGTKNGLIAGEALVFFNRKLAEDFDFRRMQGMQLASKMRFVAAQYVALLSNDLWKKNAEHANRMAKLLSDGICGLPGVTLTQKVQSNSVFAIIPPKAISKVQKEFGFHVWNKDLSEARLVTSFDTDEAEVRKFCSVLAGAVGMGP
ncbi:MAG: low specificity L-threonine aldolase [Gemmatimonadaceae bacterium]|nr:low specificity L-threonine aldolase [Gemmatimonadaceae bacterium]